MDFTQESCVDDTSNDFTSCSDLESVSVPIDQSDTEDMELTDAIPGIMTALETEFQPEWFSSGYFDVYSPSNSPFAAAAWTPPEEVPYLHAQMVEMDFQSFEIPDSFWQSFESELADPMSYSHHFDVGEDSHRGFEHQSSDHAFHDPAQFLHVLSLVAEFQAQAERQARAEAERTSRATERADAFVLVSAGDWVPPRQAPIKASAVSVPAA
jgi:hypothetical protein